MKRRLSDIKKPFGYVGFTESISISLYVAFLWSLGLALVRIIT